MNIAQPADLLTEHAPELPLATADQLQPGRIISGVGAQHAWMMLDAQAGDDPGWVRLRQLMKGVRSHTHEWTIRGDGAKDCNSCGLRMQRVADLLPVTTPRARVIIPPAGVLNALDLYTLYATATGAVVTISGHRSARIWSQALPIIPHLLPVWSLPGPLRAALHPARDSGVVLTPTGADVDVVDEE